MRKDFLTDFIPVVQLLKAGAHTIKHINIHLFLLALIY